MFEIIIVLMMCCSQAITRRLLAVTSDRQIRCWRVTGGCRRPVLAPRAGGL
jgi:hypothetical protein